MPIVDPVIDPFEHEKLPQYIAGYTRGIPLIASPLNRFIMSVGACFVGEFDKAQHLLAALDGTGLLPSGPATEQFRNDQDLFHRVAYLSEILRTDRSQVVPLLHEWEAAKVRHLDLGKFWKPTPFPCEGTAGKS